MNNNSYNNKRYLSLRFLFGYFAISYITFLAFYLSKRDFSLLSFKFEQIIFVIYFSAVTVFNIRFFVTRIFLKDDIALMCFYPIKFRTILWSAIKLNQFWVIAIISTYFGAKFSVFKDLNLVIKEVMYMYLGSNMLMLAYVYILLVAIFFGYINELKILIIEKVLYIFSVIFVPYAFRNLLETSNLFYIYCIIFVI